MHFFFLENTIGHLAHCASCSLEQRVASYYKMLLHPSFSPTVFKMIRSLLRHVLLVITLPIFFLGLVWAQSPNNQAYLFAADAESFLEQSLKTTFSCQGREYGYYADVDNNCQV